MVSRQQGRNEFNSAVRDIQTRIQDMSNDVSTGFYQNPGIFTCRSVGGPSGRPKVTPANSEQGTNEGCIFIGRAIQFASDSVTNPEQLEMYNIVGLQKDSLGKEASTYATALPIAIAKGTSGGGFSSVPAGSEKINMPIGVTTYRVQYINGGAVTNISGYGIMSKLAQYSLGIVASGAQGVDILAFNQLSASATSPAVASDVFVDSIDNLPTIAIKNPDGGINMCFNSGTSDEHAVFTFGKDKKLIPTVTILSGPASLDGSGKCI